MGLSECVYRPMKECSGCQKELTVEQFPKQKDGRFGVKGKCKVCHRNEVKKWREENREWCNQYKKHYYRNNKEKYDQYRRNWDEINRDYKNFLQREWYKVNKDRVRPRKTEIERQRRQRANND